MTVQEWQAEATERAARMLAHWMETTAADRLDWHPAVEDRSQARSVLEVVWECVNANRRLAATLQGQPAPQGAAGGTPRPDSVDEINQQLLSSARDLAEVIRRLDDAALERTYQLGPGTVTGAFLVQLPASHMAYHGGQVNYIQSLYGDTEFHFPPQL